MPAPQNDNNKAADKHWHWHWRWNWNWQQCCFCSLCWSAQLKIVAGSPHECVFRRSISLNLNLNPCTRFYPYATLTSNFRCPMLAFMYVRMHSYFYVFWRFRETFLWLVQNISDEAKDLVTKLLRKEPHKRLPLDEVRTALEGGKRWNVSFRYGQH